MEPAQEVVTEKLTVSLSRRCRRRDRDALPELVRVRGLGMRWWF